ncbi:MAG TPA: hypothetical protein VNM45_09990 [Bacillus sp. (in: firmicutes)]|nr:hypothetical protein [Bacillus sp. (in: firmicutes)]
MNTNKLFLEDLKYMVENRLPLNEYATEQIQKKFDKDESLIAELYQLFVRSRHLLPLINDIEAVVYDYIVSEEMTKKKTFYGATLFVSELFDTTQTYVKCKVIQCRNLDLQKTS